MQNYSLKLKKYRVLELIRWQILKLKHFVFLIVIFKFDF